MPPPAPPRLQVEPRPRDIPGIKVETLDGAKDLMPVEYDAVLSQAMGGVVPGMTLLIWGLPGAGKSTLAAQLGATMASAMKGICYWLDMEQLNRSLIKACFTRTGSPTDRVRVISARTPREPGYAPVTWREALAAVRPDRRNVVVIDSLQTWAGGSHNEQTALMRAAQELGPTALVISHANKKGDAAGRNTNQHSGDANVTVRQSEIIVTKCRWIECPRVLPRYAEPVPPVAP